MKIHHIGYLVKKIGKAQATFEKLGFITVQPTMLDDYRKIEICFLEKDGYCIELVSPVADDSIVSSLMKRYRNTPYHLCYVSSNFDIEITQLCKNGYTQIGEAAPAPACDGKRVVFLMNPNIGIIELLEE